MRFILGLIILALGIWVVIKTEYMLEFIGRVEWAEDKLGPGGSRTFYKLLGMVIILIGFATMTNLISGILAGIARLLVPGAR